MTAGRLSLSGYTHIATYSPIEGYGYIQDRERDTFCYGRSQTATHPKAQLYNHIAKLSGKTPSNFPLLVEKEYLSVLGELIKGTDLSLSAVRPKAQSNLIKIIEALSNCVDDNGYFQGRSAPVEYTALSSFMAKTGLLTDYDTEIERLIRQHLQGSDDKFETAKTVMIDKESKSLLVPIISRKLKALSTEDLQARTNETIKRLRRLDITTPKAIKVELQASLFDRKYSSLEQIVDQFQGKKSAIRLVLLERATCLEIQYCLFSPEKIQRFIKQKELCKGDINEGLNNLIMVFLIALVNTNARKKGLSYRLSKRQSFGFLRSTVTDVGLFKLRLSMGIESDEFAQVIAESLNQLSDLLKSVNITASEKKPASVINQMFKLYRSQKQETTSEERQERNPGTVLHKAFRTHKRLLVAIYQAEILLEAHKDDDLEEFFENFITTVILPHKETDDDVKVKAKDLSKLRDEVSAFKPASSKSSRKKAAAESTAFQTLAAVVSFVYAETNVLLAKASDPKMRYVYYHLLQKLLVNLDGAKNLLNSADKQEASAFFKKAMLYIDKLTTNYHLFNTLMANKKPEELKKDLVEHYEARVSRQLKLKQSNISAYYMGNGMQAAVLSMLSVCSQYKMRRKEEKEGSREWERTLPAIKVCLYKTCYFELDEWFNSNLKLSDDVNGADIIFVDVTQLSGLIRALGKETLAGKTVIIDITHGNQLSTLQPQLQAAFLKKGANVILVESLLKHDQLGTDKYMAGRITVLKPSDQTLRIDEQYFKRVFDEGVGKRPAVMRYLHAMERISHKPPLAEASAAGRKSRATLFRVPKLEVPTSDSLDSLSIKPPRR